MFKKIVTKPKEKPASEEAGGLRRGHMRLTSHFSGLSTLPVPPFSLQKSIFLNCFVNISFNSYSKACFSSSHPIFKYIFKKQCNCFEKLNFMLKHFLFCFVFWCILYHVHQIWVCGINRAFVLCINLTFQYLMQRKTKLENQCSIGENGKDMEKSAWFSSHTQLGAVNFV